MTEAIDSVLCQTYPNIELIVVNDGSTDDTEEKLQPYMDRITYISKENGGTSSAVNAGLRIARGKHIARLDDDDLFMPGKIGLDDIALGDMGYVTILLLESFC